MYSEQPRCHYRKSQLGQVICQLRFPEILAISEKSPVDFQEAIRGEYPQYQTMKPVPNPKAANPREPRRSHHFLSTDGAWRINLNTEFIALSTNRYTCWEDFAHRLDQLLAAFISVYKPAHFSRIGLRYINFISRKALELEDALFNDLIHERYLGIMADEELKSTDIMRSSMDMEFKIRGGCNAKLHVGPGVVQTFAGRDPEVKFIFDMDLYMPGNVQVRQCAPALHTLHSQAFSIFRAAITDRLHNAMEPEEP